MVCRCMHILRSLKEELAWATDKWFWVISNIMLFKTASYTTKKLKNKVQIVLYVLLCGP